MNRRSRAFPSPPCAIAVAVALVLAGFLLAPEARSDHPGLAFAKRGSGEPTLVLIHGLGMDRSAWDRVAPALEARHKVITVELPGHGASPPLTNVSVRTVAEELDRTLRREKVKNPVLVGQSYGGLVALASAAANPGRVRGVISIDLATYVEVDSERVANLVDLIEKRYPLFIRGVFPPMVRDSTQVDSVIEKANRVPRETMAAYFRDAWSTDLRPRVRGLKTPVLLIATDTTWPVSESWDSARKRLGYETAGPVTARRISGSGHMVPLDRPDTLAVAILEFTSTLKK
ncbi:MAG TPA: alpha/beta hydrolase [Candidatus Eisenbacteria bacterium]|nr:alpha/beta hydrolase [Candidatus Eisenbacteria bacterium]